MPKAPKRLRRKTGPKPEKEYPTSIRLRERARDLLRSEAAKQDRSMSWLVSRIIDQWFEWKQRQLKTQDLKNELKK